MGSFYSIDPMSFPPPPRSAVTTKVTKPRTLQATSKNTVGSPRRVFVLTLLLLSFIIITLGTIYASCVALPHSNDTSRSISNTTTIPPRDTTGSYAESGYDNTNPNTQSDSQKDQTEHSPFTNPAALASLGFYTLTLPVLTILHSGAELIVLCLRSQRLQSTGSVTTGKSRIGRLLSRLSLYLSTLLLLGWIPISLIWTSCELRNFMGNQVCPVQVRGHNMLGIAPLSIAKVVFAWLVVLIYISYVLYALHFASGSRRNNCVSRKARYAMKEEEMADEPEEIVIHLGEEVAKDMR